MTRWLMVSGDFVSHGGMDRANLELARYLSEIGEVDVVTHQLDDALSTNASVHLHQCQRPWGANFLGERALKRMALASERQLGNEVRSISNGGCAPLKDVNWVHYVHAAYQPSIGGFGIRALKNAAHRRRSLRWERQALHRAAIVVCNSSLTAEHVHRFVGVPEDRIRVVYYGTDDQRYRPPGEDQRGAIRQSLGWEDRPAALFVGGLGDRRKGFDLLYDAWKSLCRDDGWDVCLRVVGRGADLERWQELARLDGLGDRIEFMGFRQDVDRLLAASDLLVHPARYEAYGLGVHEAICCGIPAIVSAQAGVAERYPHACRPLQLHDLSSYEPLRDLLLAWRPEATTWRDRFRPFSDTLRCRTWQMMAREFVQAVS